MEENKFVNPGVLVLRQSDDQRTSPKTVVVTGLARSGTSMVASLLESMGISMGERADRVVFGDLEVVQRIGDSGSESWKSLVEQRNLQHPIAWGWKRPGIFGKAKEFAPSLRNPHFVVLFRDLLAIGLRNAIAVNVDTLANMKRNHETSAALLEFIETTTYPTLLVSYEKAIAKKAQFVKLLARFCNIELSPDDVTPPALRKDVASARPKAEPKP